jgi:histidyl-tRNA synthetase
MPGRSLILIIAGEEEMSSESLTVKNMSTGEQKRIQFTDLDSFVKA